jgi:hypothetical protein
MSAVNLDALVGAGQPPWQPSAAARDVEVWEKPDFPVSGTYRIRGVLAVFALITTAGGRSLWAYVPVPPEREEVVTTSRFATDTELDAFIEGCFSGQEVVFAVAQDFVIQAKSDGIRIGTAPFALLAAATQWYITRVSALLNKPAEPVPTADAQELHRAAQGALASTLA